ncbi:hypothetical protein [Bacillus sp. FJAT-29814]|uniref:hypothetical protein n=1 Tax=Bacillus sp. FJAT-29814 TaxID=1729688 RepID=UPI000830AE2E|nr:hypothetical protein [Bacillus sp. FJAT-29814]
MGETIFHEFAKEHLKEEVNVVTTHGNFEGRLLKVGTDAIVLLNRAVHRPVKVLIRKEEIVALYRSEMAPRGPFGFMPPGPEFEDFSESHDQHFSESHDHN